ncbi:MAG: nucleotidyltransferase domain-containing protein [Lachnospiraceae bacterium]|nr:nucleotidyltransferase domain-containing protein [Lachnospiraceae bacterium]
MYDIPEKILYEIRSIGDRMSIDRIIMFGSRARGDNHERSDIDLAFSARNSKEYFEMKDALENIDTLLMFDLVDLNSCNISADITEEINKDGVVIYEKV